MIIPDTLFFAGVTNIEKKHPSTPGHILYTQGLRNLWLLAMATGVLLDVFTQFGRSLRLEIFPQKFLNQEFVKIRMRLDCMLGSLGQLAARAQGPCILPRRYRSYMSIDILRYVFPTLSLAGGSNRECPIPWSQKRNNCTIITKAPLIVTISILMDLSCK